MRGDPVTTGSALARYRDALRADLPFNWVTSRRIVAEVTDHIADAKQHHMSRGLSPEEAEDRAIEQLGSARVVAVAFARARGLGMPTNTTRLGGLAGMMAPFLAFFGMLMTSEGLNDQVQWVGGGLLITSFFGLVFFLFAMWKRHAGTLGKWGKAAVILAAASPVLSLPLLWAAPLGIVGCMLVSFILLTIGATRAGMVPRAPLVLSALGPAWVIGIGAIGMLMGFDGAKYTMFGFVPLAIGFVWLGRYLWTEPAESEEGAPPPAFA